MFCSNCGTKLPDNARFCSSCGQKTEALASPQQTPDKPPFQISPEEMNEVSEGLAKKMVDELVSPLEEYVPRYVELATKGTVTADVFHSGMEWLESAKKLPVVELDKNRFYLSLRAYEDVKNAYDVLNKRWGNAMIPLNMDLLKQDFSQFLTGDLKELFVQTSLLDNETQERILEHPGLARFLKQELLSQIMVYLKVAGMEMTSGGKATLIQRHGEELVIKACEICDSKYNDYLDHARKEP